LFGAYLLDLLGYQRKYGPNWSGDIFRNSEGTILHIYADYIGRITNNAAEMDRLINGLSMAIRINYRNLIVEGDSAIII
jgi:ribonuclease HI